MHRIYPILILKFTPITIIYSKKVARIFLFFVFTQKKWQSFFISRFMYITVKMYPCSGGTDTVSPALCTVSPEQGYRT